MDEIKAVDIPNFETSPPHILVVDDEPVFVELVSLWLERANYRVTPVFSGEEALQALGCADSGSPEAEPPAFDLVLLDVMMPGLRGTEVCRRIRATSVIAQIPVLVLTALSSSVERIDALQAGANDYITKPFIGVELLTRVGNLVRWHRTEQATREEIRLRNRELQALNEVGATLNQTLRLPDLLNETLNAVCQVAGFAWGAIYLLSGSDNCLEMAAYRDIPPAFLCNGWQTPDDDGSMWQMIKHMHPVVSQSTPVKPENTPDDDEATGTYHCVLLSAKGQPVGLLVVGGDGQAEIPEGKIQLLEAIGHQIGVAVANASLFERLQRHSHKLSSLNKIMGMMLSRLDLPSVLTVIAEGLVQHWDAALARVWLLANQSKSGEEQLILRASAGMTEGLNGEHAQISLDETSLIGQIAIRRQEELSTHLEQDVQALDLDWVRREGLRSFAGFPLTYGDRLIGVLALFAREKLNQADFDLLRTFARQATTAIENARLYAHEQQQVIELKALTQKLEDSQAQLVQSAKLAAVGRLAAALAHEINNPLQSIHNCLSLSRRFPPKSQDHLDYMRMAEGELERLIGLVQRLLDFYRPSHAHRTLANVNDLIEQVATMTQKELADHRIELHLNLTPQLEPVHIITDQISQVILNLVINAMETMPDGGRLELASRQIEMATAQDTPSPSSWVEISVADDGPGLTQEQMDHIFEPFSSTPQSNGCGLGLSISFGIIERHGGVIQVASTPNAGTTFTIRLPAHPSEAQVTQL